MSITPWKRCELHRQLMNHVADQETDIITTALRIVLFGVSPARQSAKRQRLPPEEETRRAVSSCRRPKHASSKPTATVTVACICNSRRACMALQTSRVGLARVPSSLSDYREMTKRGQIDIENTTARKSITTSLPLYSCTRPVFPQDPPENQHHQ